MDHRLTHVICLFTVAGALIATAGRGRADEFAPCVVATPSKAEVVLHEPIYVRIEVRNDSPEPIAVAPPWPWGGLSLAVWQADGERLGNPMPCEGLAAGDPYGMGWYAPVLCGPSTKGRVPNALLVLAPGEAMSAWMDVLQWYPVGPPGRYHLVLEWNAGASRTRPAPGRADVPRWTGHLTADAGWITVREPVGPDAEPAVFLGEWFTRHATPLTGNDLTGHDARRELLRRWPDSTYASYLRPDATLAGPRWLAQADAERREAALAEVSSREAEWAAGLAPVRAAWRRYVKARTAGRTDEMPGLEAEYRRLQTADTEAPGRRQALLDAAWATGDFLVYEWHAARVCDTEPWAYPEVFPNGANPR